MLPLLPTSLLPFTSFGGLDGDVLSGPFLLGFFELGLARFEWSSRESVGSVSGATFRFFFAGRWEGPGEEVAFPSESLAVGYQRLCMSAEYIAK